MEAALRTLPETVTRPTPTAEARPSTKPRPAPPVAVVRDDRLARWFRLHRGQLRAAALGLVSLAVFITVWQLLTVNRATFYVRFTNVPSPADVLARAILAFRNPIFGDHIWMSCRRIFYGFTLAGAVAIPLGLLMGRFRILREIVFPICEVTRPSSGYRLGADGDHALADERGVDRLHHLPRLVLPDPDQHAPGHGHRRSGAGTGWALPRVPGRPHSSARFSCRPPCRRSSRGSRSAWASPGSR
jgi:hypothetical protein